ncbi:MAG: hypothetical protein ACR2FE_08830 [Aeromicrobium sp.]
MSTIRDEFERMLQDHGDDLDLQATYRNEPPPTDPQDDGITAAELMRQIAADDQ